MCHTVIVTVNNPTVTHRHMQNCCHYLWREETVGKITTLTAA